MGTSDIAVRLRVGRQPGNARYDRATIDRVLDRGRIAHIAFSNGGLPYCIPTLYARDGDRILIHGSTASRMVRLLARGVAACLTVTLLDGLVLARSTFEHTANYDSVVLLGRFQRIAEAEKLDALRAFTEVVLPGRWDEARAPNPKELKATAILGLPIVEGSVKTRARGPDDDGSPDASLEVWAGVVPVLTTYGAPQPSPVLRKDVSPPASVARLLSTPTP